MSAGDTDLNRRVLTLIGSFRLIVAAAMLLVAVLQTDPIFLGGRYPLLFITTACVYCLGSMTIALVLRGEQAHTRQLAWLQLVVDIACITLIVHASGGIGSGLEALLVVFVVASAMTLSARSSYFAAAIAALAVLLEQTPDRLYAARLASPLVLGRGDGENFIASDIPAILSYTRSMLFLEDGEIAELSAEGIRIENATGETVQRQPKNITWSAAMAEKEGYKHFMLKEINEQPRAITDTLRGRISLEHGDVTLDEVPLLTPEAIAGIRRILIIACGTSYHAGLVGRLWIEKFSGIPAEVDLGSEFRYRDPLLSPDTLVVSISQSGETADTLAAVKTAKEEGCKVLSICNVVDSSIARTSDGVLYTHAGPEIGVASTKAFTTQLTALYLLALAMGKATGGLSTQELAIKVDALAKVPGLVEHALHSDAAIRDVAERYYRASDFLYLGRWLNYPIALEGALKLKEISYIHAEGYPAGEMKHGPIALIDEHMPVVVIAPRDKVYEKIVSNLQEAKARHAVVIAVGEEGDNELREHAEEFIPMPACSEESLTPLLTVVPLQMLSYHIADIKGTDVDQPRNLAKSVTVE